MSDVIEQISRQFAELLADLRALRTETETLRLDQEARLDQTERRVEARLDQIERSMVERLDRIEALLRAREAHE